MCESQEIRTKQTTSKFPQVSQIVGKQSWIRRFAGLWPANDNLVRGLMTPAARESEERAGAIAARQARRTRRQSAAKAQATEIATDPSKSSSSCCLSSDRAWVFVKKCQ